jgi:hypothetical protein
MVGVIPGAGTTTTTINSVISLVRGHLIDAAASIVSMVPVVGDIVTKAKGVVDNSLDRLIAKEVAERQLEKKIGNELVEAGSQTLAREAREELTEKAAKESGETVAEITKESLEAATKEVVQETGEELAEKVATETAGGIAEKTTAETLDEAIVSVANKAHKELREDAFIEKVGEEDSNAQGISEVVDPVGEQPAQESPQRADEAQFVKSLRDQYGDEMVNRFLPFCERYGINPQDVELRPLAEGQSLIGWGLDIRDSSNPVNHPLVELNLTKDDLKNIMEKSTIRPESEVIVLGYGSGTKPYFKLSDEIGGCHLSLPDEAWAPFAKANANFWADVNAPFIEKGIEERKVFLFNVKPDTIEDPANVRRFSLPELRLIEMEKNNYVHIPVGDYSAFVPVESIDSLREILPASLLKSGGPS